MYREVYIDVVFAANLLMDYILLRLTGIMLNYQGSRRRCLEAAVTGALFSCLSLYVRAGRTTICMIALRIICATAMVWIAYRIQDRRHLAGAVTLFFGMTFLTGGFWMAISGNGKVTFALFAGCAAATYVGLSLLVYFMGRIKASRENLYPVILKYRGREHQTFGLYDTGNRLDDTITGTPVSIADPGMMQTLLTEELMEKLMRFKEMPEAFEGTELTDLRPHYLFFQTVGQKAQLILAVTVEDLCIQTPGERVHVSGPVLALSSEPFALGKEYKVILNSRLLH